MLSHAEQRTVGAAVLASVAILMVIAVESPFLVFKGGCSRCRDLGKNNFDSCVLLLLRAKAGLHFGNSHFVNPFNLVKHNFVKLFQPPAAFYNNRPYSIT